MRAAEIVEEARPEVLDINYGCPVKKVVCRMAGAGILQVQGGHVGIDLANDGIDDDVEHVLEVEGGRDGLGNLVQRERFAQADASDRRQISGTGLGLSISKAIVERMNGTIGYERASGGGRS